MSRQGKRGPSKAGPYCPACKAAGLRLEPGRRKENWTVDGRTKVVPVVRARGRVNVIQAFVRCVCGWTWWSADLAAVGAARLHPKYTALGRHAKPAGFPGRRGNE